MPEASQARGNPSTATIVARKSGSPFPTPALHREAPTRIAALARLRQLTCIQGPLLRCSVKKHIGEARRAPTTATLETEDSGSVRSRFMEAKKTIEELGDAKRGSWAVSAAVLAAVVMAVLIVSGRNVGAPVVWVQTAAATFRQGKVFC